jgi:1,4-alpha-glucan branching enzyme
MSTVATKIPQAKLIDLSAARRLVRGDNNAPHNLLGAHPATIDTQQGVIVRAFHPRAACVQVLRADHEAVSLTRVLPGLFEAFLPDAVVPLPYGFRFRAGDGAEWEQDDAYRFLPTIGEVDLHLFNEGTHYRLWEVLGAHVRTVDSVTGVSFAVWAPNAARVSVVGDFCGWDGLVYPMRQMGSSGVYELFIPGLSAGTQYKFEIKTHDGRILLKADPFANAAEHPPATASRVAQSTHEWSDTDWQAQRDLQCPHKSPVAVYEVHWGSWMWAADGARPLSYREMAPKLIEHAKRFGFTHIELMPLAEHPFGGSWGYQVTGYYAPTARYGSPDDFRYFVDQCHRAGIGVILDWVPAHFPKDSFALAQFDGTALFEHDDPRLGDHPDWGTLIFNYGRNEVKNFLIANALYWLNEFHIDGLRVDAVASMLYLDYSREDGEWMPNKYGGRENLEAIEFLKHLNSIVTAEHPGCMMIAEESTAWDGVTRRVQDGGLGFTFKWNMGWMHDTLVYFTHDPVHRRYHHSELTFAMVYEYCEHYLMPLSHDEVVHGKGALLEKMPGDLWQKFANLRTLLAYQYTRPGKVLLFAGTELAPWYEWFHEAPLNWGLADHPERKGLQRFMQDLGKLYLECSPLWKYDHDPVGFQWIELNDYENSVLSYARMDGDDCVIVVLNLTPVPRDSYRIGAPRAGSYELLLNSDELEYNGGGYGVQAKVATEQSPMHGRDQSLALTLPALGTLVYRLRPKP